MSNQANTNRAATDESAALARIEIGRIQESFKLTLVQATTLYELLARTAPNVVEAVCLSYKMTNVKLVAVRRLRGNQREKCEMGHSICFAWDVLSTSQLSTASEKIHTLGSTCASHVLNLPQAVILAIHGLSRWARRLEDKEVPNLLGESVERLKRAGVPDHEVGRRIIEEFRATSEYAEAMRGLRLIKGREIEAADPATTQRRRDFNLARLCHAIRTVTVCDDGDLPIAPSIIKRIRRAVRRLEEIDRLKASSSVPSTTGQPLNAQGSATATAGVGVLTYTAPVASQTSGIQSNTAPEEVSSASTSLTCSVQQGDGLQRSLF